MASLTALCPTELRLTDAICVSNNWLHAVFHTECLVIPIGLSVYVLCSLHLAPTQYYAAQARCPGLLDRNLDCYLSSKDHPARMKLFVVCFASLSEPYHPIRPDFSCTNLPGQILNVLHPEPWALVVSLGAKSTGCLTRPGALRAAIAELCEGLQIFLRYAGG